jgi:carboxyl-terminal processing protease
LRTARTISYALAIVGRIPARIKQSLASSVHIVTFLPLFFPFAGAFGAATQGPKRSRFVSVMARFALHPVHLLVCSFAAFAGGACVTFLGGRAATARGDTPYGVLDLLGHALVAIENEYVDPVDRRKLLEGAVRGMVAELDPHSSYMDPAEFQAFDSDTEGQFGGIGVEVDVRGGLLVVMAPIEGSPAERAGLRAGDILVTVDRRDPTIEPLDKLVKHLRGAPGTHVTVGVRRPPAEAVLAYDLVREVIHVPSVASTLFKRRIAYVRVKQFQDATHDELLAAASELRKRAGGTLGGVVLDLRGNPGGLVDQAADVADEFLASGILYTTRHRGQVVDTIEARPGGAFVSIPCVVIVDKYTASAAELVAAALQDNHRATVVGETTFGKGSVQAVIALPNGAGMRLTVARYYSPTGRAIQAEGVHPDVRVETPVPNGVAWVREEGLEGHLAGEPSHDQPRPVSSDVIVLDAGTGVQPADVASREAKLPADPERADDAVLRVAWRTLLQLKHAEPALPR